MINAKNFITGMTGVFYTAAELSSRGFIVTITARNAPTVDLLVSKPDMKKTISIQVKTNASNGTHSFWLTGKNSMNLKAPNFFYILVNLKSDDKPDFYIVPSRDLVKNIDYSKTKSGEWYSFQRNEKFRGRWDLLD